MLGTEDSQDPRLISEPASPCPGQLAPWVHLKVVRLGGIGAEVMLSASGSRVPPNVVIKALGVQLPGSRSPHLFRPVPEA